MTIIPPFFNNVNTGRKGFCVFCKQKGSPDEGEPGKFNYSYDGMNLLQS